MTLPSLVLGLVCALLIGALFHLLMNGGAWRLLLYLLLSVAGFGTGQWMADSQDWILLPIGPIDMVGATLGSLLFLGFGHWLSMVRAVGTQTKPKV